jgi:hypothetical protein
VTSEQEFDLLDHARSVDGLRLKVLTAQHDQKQHLQALSYVTAVSEATRCDIRTVKLITYLHNDQELIVDVWSSSKHLLNLV